MNTNPYGTSRFAGKTALVAGGAAGMGQKTGRRPAAGGTAVIAADRDVEV